MPMPRSRSIDTSKAEKLAGVKAVITAADLPDLTNGDQGMFDILDNCMARTKVFYDGHAVAAVAAVDAATAKAALKLIKVDYEILPHVTDVDEAVKPKAPLLHKKCFTEGVEPKPDKASNIAKRTEFGHGDVDAGFAEADVIVERNFKTEQTHQGYIEPHACVASVSPDGTGELWVCTQGHFVFRNHCALLLGMDVSKLRVTSSEIGGGFGGKTHVWGEPVALALSRKANRPVKLVMTRDEVFRASGPTAATSIDVKIGVKKDGTITAADATLRFSGGPYYGMWAELGAMTAYACYDLKNVRTVGYEVLVNRPKTAAYRAPSAPMAAFAVESVMDELASKIGMDPVEFRIKNAAKQGTKSSYGPVYGPIGIGPTLEAAKKHPHMSAPLGPNQGRGMACGFWFNFGGQTCTDINVGPDGSVTLTVGTVDVGGSRASLALCVAEELGIPYTQVKAIVADTGTLGHNDMTDGSRGTFSSSMAGIFAASNAITVLKERAAKMWEIPVDDVDLGRWPRQGHRLEPRQPGAALAEGDRGGRRQHRRTGGWPCRDRRRWCWRVVCHAYRRRRGRSRNRPLEDRALHGHPGRRQGGASDLCRRPVSGRCRTGHRLGAERGVCLRQGRTPAERRLPRLPHPGVLGSSDDRHADPGNPQPQPPLWGARRRRNLDRAAARRHRQCHVERLRRSHDPRPDVAAARPQGARGGSQGLSLAEIHLWGALRPAADGALLVHIEAKTIRELFRKLEEQYPGMAPHIARGVAVSINGKIYRDSWQTELPVGAEIYLLPRIQGG